MAMKSGREGCSKVRTCFFGGGGGGNGGGVVGVGGGGGVGSVVVVGAGASFVTFSFILVAFAFGSDVEATAYILCCFVSSLDPPLCLSPTSCLLCAVPSIIVR